jgi:anti-sigma-K factor RskA
VTADLPPAPEGKVYQLWFVTPTAKISAGLISTDKTGHGFTIVQFPLNFGELAATAITLEPEGGSQQPTSAIYVLGTSA